MTSYSIELARFFGIMLTIRGLAMVIHGDFVRSTVKSAKDNPIVLALAGLFPMIVGSWLVATHNLWASDWTVLITLLGWVMLISGAFRMLFIKHVAKNIDRFTNSSMITAVSWCALILGLIFLYEGYCCPVAPIG